MGWIFSDIKRQALIGYDKSNSDSDYKVDDNGTNKVVSSGIYATTIYITKDHNKYNLSYIKVQDLVANVGGIIQVLMVICSILSVHMNSFKRDLDVLNSLFIFKMTNPDEVFFSTDKKNIKRYLFKRKKTCNK